MPLEDSELETILKAAYGPDVVDNAYASPAGKITKGHAKDLLTQWRDKHALRERIRDNEKLVMKCERVTYADDHTGGNAVSVRHLNKHRAKLQGQLNVLEGKTAGLDTDSPS